jgi:hypothetical protein
LFKGGTLHLHPTLAPLIPLENAIENQVNNSQASIENLVEITAVSNVVEESNYHFVKDLVAADYPDAGF